jgi:transposase
MQDNWEKYGKIRTMHINGVSDRQIARALGVGRRTVRKYRSGATTPDKRIHALRKSPLRDIVEGDIVRLLNENSHLPRKQRLSATDIWKFLVSEHGIAISEVYVRLIIRQIRDAGGEEFIPLEHEIGDCAQIDWLEDVTAIIGGIKTNVQVFVCVLPHSGVVCAFAYPDKTTLSFLHGHVKALEWLGGVPRRLLYDNVRTAVLSGSGKGAITQEKFKRIESHYAFTAEFCNRAAGWEKSNVENGVKITRKRAFVPMPRVENYKGLQKHISAKLLKYNMTHKIEGRPKPIWDMFAEERSVLVPLPLSPYEVDETIQAKVKPDQTVRYDKVRYSLPHGYVGKNITLRISPFKLKIYSWGKLLYEHERIRNGGEDQYILDHYIEAISKKPRSAGQALPITKGKMPKQCRAFLELCPSKDAKKQLVDIMLLVRDIGEPRVFEAMDEAIITGKPTAELVRYYVYGQQSPGYSFDIKHGDLSDYDSLIIGKGDGDGTQ